METGLIILFTLVVLYVLVAHWFGRYSITMAIFFVIAGGLTSANALGWIKFSLTASSVETVTELTLALLLFADAATLRFQDVREDTGLPGRLLGISMPLSILLGGAIAYGMFSSQGLGFALLVATILAPTDAALGLPIFNNPRVPVRMRRALNVESGLNDGIATPLVTLFIALALEEMGQRQGYWLAFALTEIAIGAGVGIGLGLLGGWAFRTAVEKDWTPHAARQLGNPALALLIFFLARELGGNGFIAVFLAGILFGYISRQLLEDATEYTEITGTVLSIFVWVVFGSVLMIPLVQNFNLSAFVYALLSLTVVRMLSVGVALLGKRLRWDTVLMMGWLGPRGLASVVFMIMAYEAAHEAHVSYELLLSVVGWTILLSVLLHGLSALPLANWYANRLQSAPPDAPEFIEVAELSNLRRKPVNLWYGKNAQEC